MKITLIAGSSRGNDSVSMHYARHLINTSERSFRFEILEVGKYIKVLTENKDFFYSYMQTIKESEAVIWMVPVRNLLPSYEICQFIHLINRHDAGFYLENKYTTSLFTSYFFSHLEAEEYLTAACQTWNMNYIRGFHSRPDSALKKTEWERWFRFFHFFLSQTKTQFPCEKFHCWIPGRPLPYKPVFEQILPKQPLAEKKILMICTSPGPNSNLDKMIDTWDRNFPYEYETVNLSDLSLCLPCSGCMDCFGTYTCSLGDQIRKIVYPKYREADAVIFASDVCFGLFDPLIKLFLDRIFLPAYFDRENQKKTVYLFSGSLKNRISLVKYIHKKSMLHADYLIGIVNDDEKSANQISFNIGKLAEATAALVKTGETLTSPYDSELRLSQKFENEFLSPFQKLLFIRKRKKCRTGFVFPFGLRMRILFRLLFPFLRSQNQTRGNLYLKTIDRLLTQTAQKAIIKK